VPSTDNLYNAFFFPAASAQAKPAPETTDSFDGGLRYRSGTIQAQVSGWYTKFNNRLASAFDPDLNVTVYRNLGEVKKYGIDGSIAYKPIPQLTAYLFGSWNQAKIHDNIQTGILPAGVTCDTVSQTSVTGLRNCAFTAGRRESGSPVYSYGTSAVATLGPLDVGVTAKRTGKRFVFDNNQPTYSGDIGSGTQTYTAAAPAYWLVNLDARLNMKQFGMGKTYLQLNVYNLFDQLYVGGFGGGLTQATSTRSVTAGGVTTAIPTYGNPGFVQIGVPRTFSASINLDF
jgi:iron complex outermembrane receptor protein